MHATIQLSTKPRLWQVPLICQVLSSQSHSFLATTQSLFEVPISEETIMHGEGGWVCGSSNEWRQSEPALKKWMYFNTEHFFWSPGWIWIHIRNHPTSLIEHMNQDVPCQFTTTHTFLCWEPYFGTVQTTLRTEGVPSLFCMQVSLVCTNSEVCIEWGHQPSFGKGCEPSERLPSQFEKEEGRKGWGKAWEVTDPVFGRRKDRDVTHELFIDALEWSYQFHQWQRLRWRVLRWRVNTWDMARVTEHVLDQWHGMGPDMQPVVHWGDKKQGATVMPVLSRQPWQHQVVSIMTTNTCH